MRSLPASVLEISGEPTIKKQPRRTIAARLNAIRPVNMPKPTNAIATVIRLTANGPLTNAWAQPIAVAIALGPVVALSNVAFLWRYAYPLGQAVGSALSWGICPKLLNDCGREAD